MNRTTIVIIIALLGAVLSWCGPGFANTTRDIGEQTKLDMKQTARWVIFYTNIERVDRGLEPLVYNPQLEKAAFWQAEYCSRKGYLTHSANETGMKNPGDRIRKFGGEWWTYGENITIQFALNMSRKSYSRYSDEKGEYVDFGNHTVFWLNERQMGNTMVTSWMNSSGHRANIMNSAFRSIGAGVHPGTYSGHSSYYGCQVFADNTKWDFTKLLVQTTTAIGKTTHTITFNGPLPVHVIEMIENNDIRVLKTASAGTACLFEKPSTGKWFYACLYDKEIDTLYPVKAL